MGVNRMIIRRLNISESQNLEKDIQQYILENMSKRTLRDVVFKGENEIWLYFDYEEHDDAKTVIKQAERKEYKNIRDFLKTFSMEGWPFVKVILTQKMYLVFMSK